MISPKMTPYSPITPIDHFSFVKEWENELRLFLKGAGVGAIFGIILWVGTSFTF